MLPDLIEIVPLSAPVHAEVTVPGSKSITNRALVLAALAEGTTVLQGALWSEDTQVMVECLHSLGFDVKVEQDPEEFSNRTITVKGLGGRLPKSGSETAPLELFVGNAGTAARFLAAMVCLGDGVYRLRGVPRMHERPQAALFQALRQLGYRIDSPNDKLPAVIHGTGPKLGAKCEVSIEHSSQFASALLLAATLGDWRVQIVGENAEESPYVVMTTELIGAFPLNGGEFQIEPDASSASYFLASGTYEVLRDSTIGTVRIRNQPEPHWQIDARFEWFMTMTTMAANLLKIQKIAEARQIPQPRLVESSLLKMAENFSRRKDLADSIMTAIVVAPMLSFPIRFTDLGRLRVQECERVVALRTELTKCGAKVIEDGDTLTIHPSQLHGAEIETYNDHRMAMCFAVVGLKVPGIKLRNPACVKKTFPNFFQKLATPPPHGLGVTILDGHSGRKLGMDELFAD